MTYRPEWDSEYGEEYVAKYEHKRGEGRLERLLPLIDFKPDDRVADVGCGSGFLYELIRGDVAEYVGIDTSPEFIEQATQTFGDGTNATFLHVDSSELAEAQPGTFDKVFLMDVTEHLLDDVLIGILRDAHRLLVDGGTLYLHTPNLDYFMERLKAAEILPQVKGHIAVRNIPHYERILKEAGFARIEPSRLSHYSRYLKPLHALSHLPLVGDLFAARIFIAATK